jgi:hypothetical protein
LWVALDAEGEASGLVTLRRLKKFRCKILRKHARNPVLVRLFYAPRALLQIFIKTTFNHRLRGLVAG